MIELNFGKPEFALRCPGPGYPQCIADLVVEIPLSGELPTFARRGTKIPPGGYRGGGTCPPYIYGPGGYQFTEYKAVMALVPQQCEIQGRPAVAMKLLSGEDTELILLLGCLANGVGCYLAQSVAGKRLGK